MSAASTSNAPAAGRGACQSSTGNSSGRPKARTPQGSRVAINTPPSTPAAPAQTGAAATDTVANGKLASHPSPAASGRSAHAAASHSAGRTTPPSASGVTTSVTQGIATRLASSPTTDIWPNSSRLKGVSASVTTPCSCSNCRNFEKK